MGTSFVETLVHPFTKNETIEMDARYELVLNLNIEHLLEIKNVARIISRIWYT